MKTLKVWVKRGSEIESEHLVDVRVIDAQGKTLAEYGDPERSTFPRSAIKPFQALLYASVVQDPVTDQDHRRLALAAASHWAEASHVETVRMWLKDRELKEDHLICGPQTPRDLQEQRRLILQNETVCRVHNNCSGKHTAFLDYCLHRSYPLKDYGAYEHPLQKDLRGLMAELGGADWKTYRWATDGCGIPTYLVPLPELARLGVYVLREHARDERLRRLLKAFRHSPEMISGQNGFCTRILRHSSARILVKTGAEGNFWAADLDAGVSFFLKVRDGSTRASEQVVLGLLRRFSSPATVDHGFLDSWMNEPLVNWAGERIGSIHLSEGHSGVF